ncbi:ABC transporter substrate-binding protein [Ornithinibacillus californiensis]|uniref:ABC transporter substrate-binding protein n=1 Tax=Ornithinibacillus californiensis TaxID=161536 RepID=UPI00064D921A|nr:ABC transporter substrate-binding protein [Ornithinibacillus californiensis]
MRLKHALPLLTILILSLILAACGNDSPSGETEDNAVGEKQSGGTIDVAFNSEPDTLDLMSNASSPTRDIAWHIFETLVALDKDFAVQPMIAEDYNISDDQKVYTITIREGVNFHDGTTVASEDVAASLERWQLVSSVGKTASNFIEEVKTLDELTIEITLNQVYNGFLDDMAAPKTGLVIIPKEIAEEAGEKPLIPEQLIGTGPYQFENWERGKEIVLKKFDDYSQREETDWGGLTGKKEATLDQINFLIVKDPQVKLNGIKTDLYDYAQSIPTDLYEVVETTPNTSPVSYINGYTMMIPDKSEAPFDELKVRQAFQYALDKEEIAQSTYGNEEFYNMDGALFDPSQTELYSAEGTDAYLVHDQEKAKELLAESDYNGEPITIMYSNNNEGYKRISQMAEQQLEAVGFTVELEPYEWATYLEKWQDPSSWDIVTIGYSTRFSPNELGFLVQDKNSSGWYSSDRWTKLMNQWALAASSEERQEILAEMNQTVSDEIPFLKIANETTLDVMSDDIQEYDAWIGPRFWNTWKK